MRTRSLACLSSLALVACGDSLLGGDALEELLGLTELPPEVAWELRWYQGREQPLLVECGLREPWTGPVALEEATLGAAEVPPPLVDEVPEASARFEGADYAWGLGMMVLMEPRTYDGVDPDRGRTDLSPDRGTWGIVRDYALLYAEGDTELLAMELGLDPGPEPMFSSIQPGVQLVGFMPEVVLGLGEPFGALYPVDVEQTERLWEPGVPVVHLEWADELVIQVFEGEGVGGAELRGCGEEG